MLTATTRRSVHPALVALLVGVSCLLPRTSLAVDLVSWITERPYYINVQGGFASEEDFGPSLLFLTDPADQGTYYYGVSLGSQIADSFFGYSAEVVGFVGVQHYVERGLQADALGVTAYWKVYKTWRPRLLSGALPLRFGLGQGLSYASRIPIVEQIDFEPQQSAQTVHYLEWSLQIPVNSILGLFGARSGGALSNAWIGYSIFHRSTVFGLFGDGGGGVNYPGLMVEFVLD